MFYKFQRRRLLPLKKCCCNGQKTSYALLDSPISIGRNASHFIIVFLISIRINFVYSFCFSFSNHSLPHCMLLFFFFLFWTSRTTQLISSHSNPLQSAHYNLCNLSSTLICFTFVRTSILRKPPDSTKKKRRRDDDSDGGSSMGDDDYW